MARKGGVGPASLRAFGGHHRSYAFGQKQTLLKPWLKEGLGHGPQTDHTEGLGRNGSREDQPRRSERPQAGLGAAS